MFIKAVDTRDRHNSCRDSGDGSRSRLPDVDAGEVQYLRHAAETAIFLKPQRTVLFFKGAKFIAWRLRCLFLVECRRSLRYFWSCRVCLDYSPVAGTLIKKGLCHIRTYVGRMTNTVDPRDRKQRGLSRVTRSKTADGLPIHIVINTPHNQIPGISITKP